MLRGVGYGERGTRVVRACPCSPSFCLRCVPIPKMKCKRLFLVQIGRQIATKMAQIFIYIHITCCQAAAIGSIPFFCIHHMLYIHNSIRCLSYLRAPPSQKGVGPGARAPAHPCAGGSFRLLVCRGSGIVRARSPFRGNTSCHWGR